MTETDPARVELTYDAGCPNVAAARSLLIKAFTRTGVSARWREWERGSPDCPGHARLYGSPTVLVNGQDVADSAPVAGSAACRVYVDGEGRLSGVPPLDAICFALLNAAPEGQASWRWQTMAASFPAVGTALLPKLTCPLCFPAYAAILGAVGVDFVNYTPYLLPLTVIFLVVAVAVLARQSRRTGNYSTLTLGIAASVLVLAGKFHAESDWLANGGVVLLVVAVFLGSRTKPTSTNSCPACAPGRNEESMEAR
jgi:hypothetical protein